MYLPATLARRTHDVCRIYRPLQIPECMLPAICICPLVAFRTHAASHMYLLSPPHALCLPHVFAPPAPCVHAASRLCLLLSAPACMLLHSPLHARCQLACTACCCCAWLHMHAAALLPAALHRTAHCCYCRLPTHACTVGCCCCRLPMLALQAAAVVAAHACMHLQKLCV